MCPNRVCHILPRAADTLQTNKNHKFILRVKLPPNPLIPHRRWTAGLPHDTITG
jgi:hypothetical protein